MKRRKSGIGRIIAVVLTAMLLIGCGASKDNIASMEYDSMSTAESEIWDSGSDAGMSLNFDMKEQSVATNDMVAEEAPEMETESSSDAASGSAQPVEEAGLENTVASNRKLIRRVNLSVETQEFTETTDFIEQKVMELGGYMESSEIYAGNYYSSSSRNAHYVVRVPVDKLDELINEVSKNANITRKSESATDVTLSYVDTKSRKEAYEVEYERLMALLEKAEDIETIVALEGRLTDVRYEIQGLESQLRTYDNLVDYATIQIELSEVVIYTPAEPEQKTDLQRMTEGFVHSLKNIGNDCKEFVIDFVIALPYLVIWTIIIGIVILIIRKIRKRRKHKKEMNRRQYADRGQYATAKEDGLRDTDRKTERGEINTDEPIDRAEDSDHIKQTADNKK